MPIHIEESICSFKCKSPIFVADNGVDVGSLSDVGVPIASKSTPSESKLNGYLVPVVPRSQDGAGFDRLGNNHHVSSVVC